MRATIDWYVKTLAFTETAYRADLNWGEVEKDGVTIMISKPAGHMPFAGSQFTGSFYFFVTDVETLWHELKDTPHVFYNLETFEYGMKEFAIKDCNGYILQFGQDAE